VTGTNKTFKIQIGRRVLTGVGATGLMFVIGAAIVTAIVYARPAPSVIASALIWVAFTIYWSAAARHASAARQAESMSSRRRHELLLNLALLLLFVPIPWLNARVIPAGVFTTVAGFLVQGAGFGLAAWARRHLGRQWSGAVTIKVDHRLVTTGPYRRVRHPIYTAMLTMAIGTALVSGRVHALVGVVVMAGAYARKIPLEERVLAGEFGDEFARYRGASAALVPWVF
jgi:protein-S-isoprenylcysteine O-methyltransferase Ste14